MTLNQLVFIVPTEPDNREASSTNNLVAGVYQPPEVNDLDRREAVAEMWRSSVAAHSTGHRDDMRRLVRTELGVAP